MPGPTHPAHLVLGLAIWSLWFIVIYGGLSVGCAIAPPATESGPLNWLNAALLLSTTFTLAVLAWLMLACWRTGRHEDIARRQRFIAVTSAGLYAVATLSTLVIGLPAAALPPCV